MKPEVREHLIEYVIGEIEQAKVAVSNSQDAVRQTADISYTRDDARPIWDAQRTAALTNGKLKSLKDCHEELEQAGPMDMIGYGAEFISCLDDEELYGLVIGTKVDLPGIRAMTPNSPMIKAIWGQRVGFSTTYEAPDGPKQVKILEIH